MKRFFVFAALAAFALTACEQKIDVPADIQTPGGSESTGLVFTATTESAVTKTALDDNYNVLWQNGDKITIVDGASHVGVYSTTSTTTQGEFTKESGDMADTPSYTAYYPSTIYKGGTLTLPAEQTYVAENISGAPMMAVSSTTSLGFKNLVGIIKLSLTTNQSGQKVRSIALSANEGMSGPFTVTSDAAVVSGTAGVTLNCGTEGVAIGSTSKPFYIAVPAGTYSSLKITVVTTDGEVQTRTSNKDIEVGRSQITNITLSFNTISATTGSADIIGGVSQPWVQLWAGGPKWAKFNVGSTITSYENVTEWTDYTVGPLYNGTSDFAASIWGANWKLPNAKSSSDNDFADLRSKCTWEWCDGVNVQYEPGCTLTGFKVTGIEPGYTNNSIFLPAAGEKSGSTLQYSRDAASFWHSWVESGTRASVFAHHDGYFHSNSMAGINQWQHSVRAICVDDQTYEEGQYYASSGNINDIVTLFNASSYVNPSLILTGNISVPITITRADGIIDFNGKTVSGNIFLQNNVAGKTVTLKNGTLSADLDGKEDWYDFYEGAVFLENMTINGAIFTDGHAYEFISGNYNGAINNYVAGGKPGTVVIRDGLFLGNYEPNGDHGYRGNCDKGSYTLYGGKYAVIPTNANQTCASGYSVQANTGSDSSTYPYIVAVAPKDLSSVATANSYIVSSAGKYKFRATVKGNGAAELAGISPSTDASAINSASLVWASYSTSVAPAADELIKDIHYSDGYVYFSTADSFREGNAVIAITDNSSNILWSWHIWVHNYDESYLTGSNNVKMMDRNLGALSTSVSSTLSYGMYYQWGRKDPFIGTPDAVSGTARAVVDATGTGGVTVGESILHPANYYVLNINTANRWEQGDHWCSETATRMTLWAESAKTIFDPCPPGWRVPSHSEVTGMGITFSAAAGFAPSGYIETFGVPKDTGGNGGAGTLWKTTNNGTNAGIEVVYGLFNSGLYRSPDMGFNVRCVKE